jgi:hypothetical protein
MYDAGMVGTVPFCIGVCGRISCESVVLLLKDFEEVPFAVRYRIDLTPSSDGFQDCDSDGQGAAWITLLLGLNMGIQCFIGEVPMFFLSGWLLKTLGR